MTQRKGEVTARMNERDYPRIVELLLPSGGFRSKFDEMLAFHRERGIEHRRGRGSYARWAVLRPILLCGSSGCRCVRSSVRRRSVDVSHLAAG